MDYLRLGPALREARKARSLTQIQLKEQLGCSQSQISELEQGIPNAVSRELLNSNRGRPWRQSERIRAPGDLSRSRSRQIRLLRQPGLPRRPSIRRQRDSADEAALRHAGQRCEEL